MGSAGERDEDATDVARREGAVVDACALSLSLIFVPVPVLVLVLRLLLSAPAAASASARRLLGAGARAGGEATQNGQRQSPSGAAWMGGSTQSMCHPTIGSADKRPMPR